MGNDIIWLRRENRLTERRTPLLPQGARTLIEHGYNVIVEHSQKRIIADSEYENAGCTIVASGSWVNAPKEAIILGLKELPPIPEKLKNTHIYFAHAYKSQSGWQELLSRFTKGGGNLLDLEYMVDQNGKRVVAFGYWAGYMGAALALLHWHSKQNGSSYLDQGLSPFEKASALDKVIEKLKSPTRNPKVLIIGAGGRSGKGAFEILSHHGADITCWGRNETKNIDRKLIIDHDILINCAFVKHKIAPFLRKNDITNKMRLSVVADVSCDPFSSFNPIPLYHDTTTWDSPYINVQGDLGQHAIDIIAIDNLPSLLPHEASIEFSEQLLPHLITLKNRAHDPVWLQTQASFDKAVNTLNNNIIIVPQPSHAIG
ncbi:MAG: saccharopine dehydrogenase [Emcibacter sp.]|nr:saccharopine dehydrogenase [Emcibacter sp.]